MTTATLYTITLPDGSQRQCNAQQLQALHLQGRIHGHTPCWREGLEEWATLAELADEAGIDLAASMQRAGRAAADAAQQRAARKKSATRWRIAILLVALCGLATWALLASSPARARATAKEAVRAQLRAPAQAVITITAQHIEGDSATIAGTVDAPTPAGTLIRYHFEATMHKITRFPLPKWSVTTLILDAKE